MSDSRTRARDDSASGRRERAREGAAQAGGELKIAWGRLWVCTLVYLIAFIAVLFAVVEAVETLTSSGS